MADTNSNKPKPASTAAPAQTKAATKRAKKATKVTRTTTFVDVARIAIVPRTAPKKYDLLKNSRVLTSPQDDQEFSKHISTAGILQPIGVAPVPKGMTVPKGVDFIVVWGNRRFQAITTWLEKQIRHDHERVTTTAKETAKLDKTEFDAKGARASLKKKLATMPTQVEAVVIDGAHPLELAAQNFRENAARVDLHWTDTAARCAMLRDAAKKQAGKSLPKSAGSGAWIADQLGISKSLANNYMRVTDYLCPTLIELARRQDGNLGAKDAIALAAIGSKATTLKERHLAQQEEFKKRTGEAEPAESEGKAPERVVRPGLDELEALLADVDAGAYAERQPKNTPRGSADFKAGFVSGYQVAYTEALQACLRFATGRRKTFPRA